MEGKSVTSHKGGGGGVSRNVTKCHTGEGGLKSAKKCYILFEWPPKHSTLISIAKKEDCSSAQTHF
jgi:hypothetical protein